MKEGSSAGRIKSILDDKFGLPRSLIAFEVGDAIGSAGNGRYADAVAMELWPSKGYRIVGFEIKASRSDWLNELKAPEKSAAVSRFCDEWYLVAPKGVLGVDELPKTWGYYQAGKSSLTKMLTCPCRDPIPPDRGFMASFMRRCIQKHGDNDENKTLLTEKVRAARDEGLRQGERDNALRKEKVKDLESTIMNFQKASGVRLSTWDYEETATAINSLRKTDVREHLLRNLVRDRRLYQESAKRFEEFISAVKNWPKERKDK